MFTNEKTAKQFEAVPGFEYDQMIHLPGQFSKLKSQLTPEEAKKLVDGGANYIRVKSEAQLPTVKAAAAPVVTQKKSESENLQ